MKLGKEKLEALRAQITGELKPGQELVVTRWIALKGTSVAVVRKEKELRQYFSGSFLHTAREFDRFSSVEEEWRIGKEQGAGAMYALGEGGILAGLWKMAEASGVGLSVQLRKIPIRQETVEICERLDLNPYQLLSEGSVLMGTEHGPELVQALEDRGIPAVIIGYAAEGNDRLLHNQEHIRYLDRPQRDEIYKIISAGQENA